MSIQKRIAEILGGFDEHHDSITCPECGAQLIVNHLDLDTVDLSCPCTFYSSSQNE